MPILTMALHIGRLVHKIAKEKGIRPTDLAEKIHTSKQNLNSIFKRETIDTGILSNLSAVLDYNFFADFIEGELLSPKVKREIAVLKQEIKDLQRKFAIAQKELDYLKKINTLQEKIIGGNKGKNKNTKAE